jgi:hypothetical protein
MSARPLALALAAAAALTPFAARAALGQPEASIDGDRRALAAVARGAVDRGGYTVHELATGGNTVREYVGPGGVVFAVTWSGLAVPDLGPLLGSYAGEYQQATGEAQRVRGRRASRVAGADVVVERWGHMRDRHGRAYLPALLPPGVNVDAIE